MLQSSGLTIGFQVLGEALVMKELDQVSGVVLAVAFSIHVRQLLSIAVRGLMSGICTCVLVHGAVDQAIRAPDNS